MELPPRRTALKRETAASHQALDDLIGDFTTRDAYARYLHGMARFRAPIEAWLQHQSMPDELEDWRPEFYGEDIIRDLADLGNRQPDKGATFAPPPGAGLMGLLYVLEGSALGARLLAKRAERLDLTADFGARHLFRQAGNFVSWRTFSDRMEKVWVYDDSAAAAWANATFAYARNAFEGPMNAARPDRRPY